MSNHSSSKYTITIGIECHVQLATKTKLFSTADNDARNKAPNTCLAPIDYALPGMLPLLNHHAVELAVIAGRALNATINPISRFDRKHYFYPDLPKGYQITQLFQPIIGAGHLDLPDGSTVRIEHAHLEEDAGKLSHTANYSLVDLNRAGTPLIEIVSMPDIHSAAQAAAYCKELWRAMTFARVSYGDLYHGNMRFDVNISLAPKGSDTLGTRAEIKNLNSFRSVERAVEYEYTRQAALLDAGKKVLQETRGWNDATGKTTSQRSKEVAADYRYMPDPDLPPIHLSPATIEKLQASTPTLPSAYRETFTPFLSSDIIEVLLDHQSLCRSLLEIIQTKALDKKALTKLANLFTSVLLAEDNLHLLHDNHLPSTDQFIELIQMNQAQALSSTATKTVLLALFNPKHHSTSVKDLAQELHLLQENDTTALATFIDAVLADPQNQSAIADYKSGQTKVLGFLVGQVMKTSRGTANPAAAKKLLEEKLQA